MGERYHLGAEMREDKAWEAEFEERKNRVRERLIKDGKVDWVYLEVLSGRRNRHEFGAAIGVLINTNILTMNRKGFFVMGSGAFCNPRAPVLWGMELFFVNRQDCQDYVDTQFKDAQYRVDIAEMT